MTKCTVDTMEFVRLITDSLVTAGADFTLPLLAGIYLHRPADRHILAATSTDRFVLSQSHIPCDGDFPEIFLPSDDLRSVLAVLRPFAKRPGSPLEIDTDDDSVTFRQVTLDSQRFEVHVTIPRSTVGDFTLLSSLAKLMKPERSEGAEVDWATVDSRKLAAVLKVAVARHELLQLEFNGPNKPVQITIGEQYRALIMPVKSERREIPILPVAVDEQKAVA